jgi:hypothetical protein
MAEYADLAGCGSAHGHLATEQARTTGRACLALGPRDLDRNRPHLPIKSIKHIRLLIILPLIRHISSVSVAYGRLKIRLFDKCLAYIREMTEMSLFIHRFAHRNCG